MLMNETLRKMRELRLGAMADALIIQSEDPSYTKLSFDDRLSLLVDYEWSVRKNNIINKLIKRAGYSQPSACIENVDYSPSRNLNQETILKLAACTYIPDKRNIIIKGATGTGKTYLACALGIAANKALFQSKYIRLPDLLVEMQIARGEGKYRELLKKYRYVPLLIIDEWLLYPLTETEARDVLELVESRLNNSSTIFCSQFDVPAWHQSLYDPTMADAICDRIIFNSYTITISGDSMRRLNAVE